MILHLLKTLFALLFSVATTAVAAAPPEHPLPQRSHCRRNSAGRIPTSSKRWSCRQAGCDTHGPPLAPRISSCTSTARRRRGADSVAYPVPSGWRKRPWTSPHCSTTAAIRLRSSPICGRRARRRPRPPPPCGCRARCRSPATRVRKARSSAPTLHGWLRSTRHRRGSGRTSTRPTGKLYERTRTPQHAWASGFPKT